MSDATESSGSILFDFADQLLSDMEAGRLRPLAHYLARFPGHEEAVAREYIALTTPTASAAAATSAAARRLDRIGPYRVVEVLGRGGQGVVYRAVDARLDRAVALKVLTIPVASVSQGRRTRFRREAEILARLDHPGICAVLDADLDGEVPYIAMRFVEGETLAAALIRAREERERGLTPSTGSDTTTSASKLLVPRRGLELAGTLAFFERAARALHAAHEAGVVHRDVKPGNLMVASDGAPVILDFGLARESDEESAALTRSDEVFGTPAYISPEQLESGRRVDRRTDVYSLGVVLYECLTLERPFQGESSAALADAIRRTPMPSPRIANPALPADLAIVLETALEKDVGRRYPTALELAEELRRVREYEPIRARPAGPLLRLSRWAQRNPVLATATIGSILALSIALGIALVLLERVRTEEQRKEAALSLYEGGWFRDEATGSLQDSPPRALDFAIAAAEHDPGLASNRVLLAALEALHERQVLVGHGEVVYSATVDPASRRIATGSGDGRARVFDAATGAELARFELGSGAVYAVGFADGGARLAFAGAGGRACMAQVDAPDAPPIELAGHTREVYSIDLSADGTRLVTASRDGTARVFDARTGEALAVLGGGIGALAEARFAGGGALVMTRSAEPVGISPVPESDGAKRLFEARTGRQIALLSGAPGTAASIDASPDGRFVAAACDDRSAHVWDLARPSDPPVLSLRADGRYHAVRFSPDSRSLALSWDAGARVVDLATGRDRYVLPSHGRRAIVRIAWSPDGEELATAAYDDMLRVFRAEDGALLRACRGSARQIVGLSWSPDGSFLVTWQRQLWASVWHGADRPFLPVLRGHAAAVRSARFSRDGSQALTASEDGTARVWRVPSGRLERVLDPRAAELERAPLLAADFGPDAVRAVSTDANGRVLVWDARDGRVERCLEAPGAAPVPARIAPDGARVALADRAGGVRLLDLASGVERWLGAHEGELTALCFSPDGRLLATGGSDRRIALWEATQTDAQPARPLWRTEPYETDLRTLTHVFDLAFAPDGTRIAAALQSARLEVFDLDGRRVARSPRFATPGLVAFAPETAHLVTTSRYGRATTLWRFPDPAAGDEIRMIDKRPLPLEHHTNSLTGLAKARGRPLAVTGSLDGTAHLWDLRAEGCVASYAGHADAVFDADVTADGAWILTASGDGTARLWPGDLLAAARAARPAGYGVVVGPLLRPALAR
ncbi:MAG: protein kinase [Planctomycetes bacterium]|nr:protein kinase [Planctomycetota bacterium]